MARTHAILDSTHPDRIAEAVAKAEAQGYQLVPPWPDESGVARFSGHGPFAAPHWAYARSYALRTEPGPGRWWPVGVILGAVAVLSALAALVARG